MSWTVLVVEDNRALADTLVMALSLLPEAEILVAYDGAEGRRLLPQADALCTDLDLPYVHGEVLIREFRALKPGAPVIAMSAGPGERAGADRFFPKPYSTLSVRETLKGMLYG
jgi:DNA-binding response OmpR family regulator